MNRTPLNHSSLRTAGGIFCYFLSKNVWLKFVLSVGGSGLVVAKLLYRTFSKIDPLKIVRMVKNVKMMLIVFCCIGFSLVMFFPGNG